MPVVIFFLSMISFANCFTSYFIHFDPGMVTINKTRHTIYHKARQQNCFRYHLKTNSFNLVNGNRSIYMGRIRLFFKKFESRLHTIFHPLIWPI